MHLQLSNPVMMFLSACLGKMLTSLCFLFCSKHSVAQVVSSQQRVNPEAIFPPESFCNIAEGNIFFNNLKLRISYL
jgi:hypothetical protein